MALLVEREHLRRAQQRLQRRIKQAHLTLEHFEPIILPFYRPIAHFPSQPCFDGIIVFLKALGKSLEGLD